MVINSPGTSYNLPEEGKLGDAAVLDLNVTKAVEALLGGVSAQHTEGVEEAERRLGSELFLERLEGGRGCLLGDRGKGGSAGKEGGKNSSLHDHNTT